MKICMIAIWMTNPISDKLGACEKIIYYLAKELSRHHEVHFIVNSKTMRLQPDELRRSIYFHGFDDQQGLLYKLFAYLRFAFYLRDLDARYGFDVFHSFSFLFAPITLILAKVKGKKTIFSELSHVTWINPIKTVSSKIHFYINVVLAVRLATVILVPSVFIKDCILERIKCPRKKVIVIPHGVPSPKVVPPQLFRKKYNVPQNSPILTFIGRLTPHKGVHTLIAALFNLKKSFPNIRLVVVGPLGEGFTADSSLRNSYYEYLLSLIASLNLNENIIFTGFLSVDEVYNVLRDSTIFVFLSTEEAFGLVLIEALSMGLPIVTTNIPPMNEIVDNESGRLIEPNNPEQITKAFHELLSNSSLKKISQHNRNRFLSEYELTHMIRKYNKIFQNIL